MQHIWEPRIGSKGLTHEDFVSGTSGNRFALKQVMNKLEETL